MKPFSKSRKLVAALVATWILSPGTSLAVPLDVYGGPLISDALKADPRACLNVGDAISCSAGMLNVLTGRDATDKTKGGSLGYVLDSPQGALKTRIVLGTGGNASTDNGDIDPTASAKVEDGYKTNNAGDNFAATGKDGHTAGNLADPTNNALNPLHDQKGTWDVSIEWLIQALTVGGIRNELMMGFDYNQAQNATGSVNYWALISVLDYDAGGNIVGQKTFEINNSTVGVNNFTSTKTFDSKPDGSEFGTVFTKTCYLKDGGGNVIDVIPITGGQCSQFGNGYETVNNASGDNTTEILAFLPELNSGLEGFLAAGYDTISVRMLFGCFDDINTPKSGQGYLSGGATTQCDGGGNVDIYLLGQSPFGKIPEPGSLALIGLSLAALGIVRRRRFDR